MSNYYELSAGTDADKVNVSEIIEAVTPMCKRTAKCVSIVGVALAAHSAGAIAAETVCNAKAVAKTAKSAKATSKTVKKLGSFASALAACKAGQDGTFYVLKEPSPEKVALAMTLFFVLLCGFSVGKSVYEEV